MDFFPTNKRTDEHLRAMFEEKGLSEIVKLHLAQVSLFLNDFHFSKMFALIIGFSKIYCVFKDDLGMYYIFL